jgi:DNA topoisomerase-1
MVKTLIITESPVKAKKIQEMLGSNYYVLSSVGHICNLKPNNQGVNIQNNFEPIYEIDEKKKDIYNKLIRAKKDCDKIIFAADQDREGEAIAWHLARLMNANLLEKNRIVFTEITKQAITNALAAPRCIDMNLVNAQKSRQIEDYIVGYELSPIIKKFVNADSAGRVQSSVNKIIYEKEKQIENHKLTNYFYTIGTFNDSIKGKLNKKIEDKPNIIKFLEDCKVAEFKVSNLEKKDCKKLPQAPFTTSTAQIEIGKRFRVPVKLIMSILQGLYQNGMITYHRTDSTTLSNDIIKEIKEYVIEKFGENYVKLRNYKTKTKCAQEAHEAIRPTSILRENLSEEYDDINKKIYKLIWERTVASQMTEMRYERYTLTISISTRSELFIANADKIIFDGYTIIYNDKFKDEDDDPENEEPENKYFEGIAIGNLLKYTNITSNGKVTRPPSRYTESTLVKEMQKLGIGRPSTYAGMISKIQDRKYVEKSNFGGIKVELENFVLENDKITEKKTIDFVGKETGKLTSTSLGKNKNTFLEENFKDIVDYKYTANLENELDNIANGNKDSFVVLDEFYKSFHPTIEKLKNEKCDVIHQQKTKRLVGKDIKTGKNIYAYNARYGDCLQIGEDSDKDKRYIGLDKFEKKYTIDSINEIEANTLTQFPKSLGEHEGNEIIVSKGKHGYYLIYNGNNYNIKSEYDQFLSKENAITCLTNTESKKVIKSFSNGKINIRDIGKGPFIQMGSQFIPIPKDTDINLLTEASCKELIKTWQDKPKSFTKSKSTTKSTTKSKYKKK